MELTIKKFVTETCTYCRAVEPHLKAYAVKHNLRIIEIDAEKDIREAQKYGVMSAPVVVFEEGDRVMAKAVGFPEIMALIS